MMVPGRQWPSSSSRSDGKRSASRSGHHPTELHLADRMREQGIAYTPLKFQSAIRPMPLPGSNAVVAVTSDAPARRQAQCFPDPDSTCSSLW